MPTYGATRTKFLDRLKRRDCTTTLADGFLQDAFKRIQRVLRIPAGEKSVVVEIDDATYLTAGSLPIPSDYLQIKDIVLTNSAGFKRTLKRRPLEEVNSLVDYGAEGTTWAYARRGAAWVLGPAPLEGDSVRIDYYSEYESAEVEADETILLDIADDLILYGALSYAADHWIDKRGPLFEQRFTQILSDLQEQADEDELAGNAQVRQAFTYPSDD